MTDHLLATCPVCQGTTRVPITPEQEKWKHMYAAYDKATDTLPCRNCGGQTMGMRAKGVTRVDPTTGQGCVHTYVGRNAGRCYTIYTCSKCGDHYDIDSGD